MKWNIRFKGTIFTIISCLMLIPAVCTFAESTPKPPVYSDIPKGFVSVEPQPAVPPSTLTKADLDAIQQIVDESVGKKIRPVIRDIAELKQPKEAGFKEIIGGIGYIFGLVGVALYFLSKKEK